jgi:hypothetical protein
MSMSWIAIVIFITCGIFVAAAVGVAIKAVFFTDYRE